MSCLPKLRSAAESAANVAEVAADLTFVASMRTGDRETIGLAQGVLMDITRHARLVRSIIANNASLSPTLVTAENAVNSATILREFKRDAPASNQGGVLKYAHLTLGAIISARNIVQSVVEDSNEVPRGGRRRNRKTRRNK